MGKQRGLLALISLLFIGSLWVIYTLPTNLGLDLRGGSQITIQINPTKDIPKITERELEAVTRVIENRVNGLGVSEPIVQTVNDNQIQVQIPGVNDPKQAERVLGGTAQLEFRGLKTGKEGEFQARSALRAQLTPLIEVLRKEPGKEAEVAQNQAILDKANTEIAELFTPTELTGKYLKDAGAQPTAGTSWEISLRFTDKGGDLFAALTKEIAGTGRPLGIFLDNVLISAPSVGAEFAKTGITGGGASITGRFTTEEASDLAIQLRGGSLPLPIQIIETRTIGASLGQDSIQSSLYAGIGGLAGVLIFMVIYYRLPGAIANISLLIYAVLNFAAFKLLGVTLTLPGIAGFILSIGMAVDANVLIFERTREELKAGKTLYRSVESGFYRAFSSILDGNVTTLIACGMLFWLGSGLVKGFALTLAIGVMISMFTAITCSRTLLMTALTIPSLRKPSWFCPGLSNTTPAKS